jgi:hypothetical protein
LVFFSPVYFANSKRKKEKQKVEEKEKRVERIRG